MSQWIKVMTVEGTLRAVAVQATPLVQEMIQAHQIQGSAAKCLGESVVAGMLLAASAKPGERVNLNIRGTGEVLQALIDARPEGTVRGYVVQKPDLDLTASLDRRGPWGDGLLSVLRTNISRPDAPPYIGTVPILTGHMAKDLTFYLHQSEQIPSAVALAIKMKGNELESALGILVQALPGAEDGELKRVTDHLQNLGDFLDGLDAKSDPMFLISKVFEDESFLKLEEKSLSFECECSIERVLKSLVLIGKAEIQSILDKEGQAEVNCDFCSTQYRVDRKKLEELLASVS